MKRKTIDLTIQHHPSDATLVAHAAGTLWEAAALVVDAHLDRCPRCTATVRLAEAVGGTVLDGLTPAPLAPDAFQRMQARLQQVDGTDQKVSKLLPAKPDPAGHNARHSTALQEIGKLRLGWLAPGIRHAVVQRWPSGETLRLLQVRSGTALPHHGHDGAELTMVLRGAFVDGTVSYGAGDVAEVDGEVRHQPVAEGSADCVCLIATQRRLRFGGLLGRLMGALVRI